MPELCVSNWFGDIISHPKALVEADSAKTIAQILRDTAQYPSPADDTAKAALRSFAAVL